MIRDPNIILNIKRLDILCKVMPQKAPPGVQVSKVELKFCFDWFLSFPMVAAGEGGAGSTGTTEERRENEIICIFEVLPSGQ